MNCLTSASIKTPKKRALMVSLFALDYFLKITSADVFVKLIGLLLNCVQDFFSSSCLFQEQTC